jgi:hypothetical protein
MRIVNSRRMLLVCCAVLLLSPGAAFAQPGVVIVGRVGWPWPAYGPYWSYPYGAYAPWSACRRGFCPDDLWLLGAIRREMQQEELRRDLERRAGAGFPQGGESLYGVPRYLPPPTPESQLQPAYRGSGDVRPEYRNSGHAL